MKMVPIFNKFLYDDIDLSQNPAPKWILGAAGYHAGYDVFNFDVNRSSLS
jgi:hypothetical protein